MFVLSGLFHACLDNNSGDEVHQGYADQEHVAEEVKDQGRLVPAHRKKDTLRWPWDKEKKCEHTAGYRSPMFHNNLVIHHLLRAFLSTQVHLRLRDELQAHARKNVYDHTEETEDIAHRTSRSDEASDEHPEDLELGEQSNRSGQPSQTENPQHDDLLTQLSVFGHHRNHGRVEKIRCQDSYTYEEQIKRNPPAAQASKSVGIEPRHELCGIGEEE
jgi:hypothetical protein